MLSVKREAVNTNFKVIGQTRLGIKPESTALEADDLTTRPSDLLNIHDVTTSMQCSLAVNR